VLNLDRITFSTAVQLYERGGEGRGCTGVRGPLPLERDGVGGGGHWLQRLSLVLARGQASLVLGAVASARNNAEGASGRKASPEFSETGWQPSVSL
jgi:hypothetical protein